MPVRIGLIGFGEVGSTLSKPLREKGAEVSAYDILFSRERGKETLEKRAKADGIKFLPLPDVIEKADFILSMVTTQVARTTARDCAGLLGPGQVYFDLNSTSPSVKVELDQIIRASGAKFVEGAILGAVGATGAKTHILTGGAEGERVAETFTALGLHVSHYSSEIGKASMFKMLRGIFSKGLEGLILELLVSGKRAGIEKELWADIAELMTANPFTRTAANWVQSHAVACERRYHEMVQVVETMREIGIEPIMTAATEALFERSMRLGFKESFPEKPASMEEVVTFMEKKLAAAE